MALPDAKKKARELLYKYTRYLLYIDNCYVRSLGSKHKLWTESLEMAKTF